MSYKNVRAVYFSPMGAVKRYVCAAAKMFSENCKETDLTDFDKRVNKISFNKDDLAIIGTPAYFGRMPRIENGLLGNVSGNGAKALLFIIHGNMGYEDALLELKTTASKMGFKPFAAAALIATPSFFPKISKGRPNENDLELLGEFIEKAKVKLADEAALAQDFFVKGNYPFRPYEKLSFHPEGNEKCNKCRVCFQICPTGAIDAESPKYTDALKCISCMACTQACPKRARGLHSLKAKVMLKISEIKLAKYSGKPEFFL